jgi:hypothetical protein
MGNSEEILQPGFRWAEPAEKKEDGETLVVYTPDRDEWTGRSGRRPESLFKIIMLNDGDQKTAVPTLVSLNNN